MESDCPLCELPLAPPYAIIYTVCDCPGDEHESHVWVHMQCGVRLYRGMPQEQVRQAARAALN